MAKVQKLWRSYESLWARGYNFMIDRSCVAGYDKLQWYMFTLKFDVKPLLFHETIYFPFSLLPAVSPSEFRIIHFLSGNSRKYKTLMITTYHFHTFLCPFAVRLFLYIENHKENQIKINEREQFKIL